ncbi:MAG: competence/damage-inducible protein A [Anaerolineae bacterium]|nr:competence/damage-inducible protein A [Anaerolineae bacterium]
MEHNERPLQVEIVAVGTEIAMGRIQDTNSSWIAGRVAGLGAFINRITIVPDEEEYLLDVLRSALERQPDAVIVTGGMGPTEDDVTVACVARLLGVPLELHEETVERFVQRRNLKDRSELSQGALKMATVPAGAEVGQNPVGSAPELHLHRGATDIFVLPGPPKEMMGTFEAHVMPALARRASRRTCCLRLAVEMHESEVAPLIHEVSAHQRGTYLKAYVALWSQGEGFLPVDIVATGESEGGAQEAAQTAFRAFTGMVEARGRRWRLMDGGAAG